MRARAPARVLLAAAAELPVTCGGSRAENEQEALAIAALQEAVRIQPAQRAAWLALATSYTNEASKPRTRWG